MEVPQREHKTYEGSFGNFSNIRRFDPAVKPQILESTAVNRTNKHIEREELNQNLQSIRAEKKKKFEFLAKIYGTQVGVAIGSSVLAAILLYGFNPGITQKSRAEEFTSEKQDWRRVLIVCLIVLGLVFVGPEILRFFRIFG